MSFFQTARRAGAEEYGRRHADAYGRQARVVQALGVLAVAVLVVLTIAAAQGAFGG